MNMNEELLEYLKLCVWFKHTRDNSPKITKEAELKENDLFERATLFLQHFDISNKICS